METKITDAKKHTPKHVFVGGAGSQRSEYEQDGLLSVGARLGGLRTQWVRGCLPLALAGTQPRHLVQHCGRPGSLFAFRVLFVCGGEVSHAGWERYLFQHPVAAQRLPPARSSSVLPGFRGPSHWPHSLPLPLQVGRGDVAEMPFGVFKCNINSYRK